MHPSLTPLAAALPATVPFVGPETLERGRNRPLIARLGANESGFGPSPRAVEAMAQAAQDAWMYGDPEMHDLRAALARHHGVTPAHIVVGEGIDGILGNLLRLTVAPGDTAVTSDGAYPTFGFHVTGFGANLVKVPYLGDHEHPEALLEAARATGAKLLYLANPDNPMGSHHPAETIGAVVDALPPGTLLVIDEAYIDLAPPGTAPDIPADDPRVIRLRTFSKGYGLAGLRVGYAIAAPSLVAAFDRVRNHFGVGRVAQAGALAALGDQDWLVTVTRRVVEGRARLAAIGASAWLRALPSATNFVALDTGRNGAYARSLLQALGDRDIFVRMPGVAPLDRCIRVTVGPPAALDRFEAALGAAVASLG